jgi:hypothetical protein
VEDGGGYLGRIGTLLHLHQTHKSIRVLIFYLHSVTDNAESEYAEFRSE